MSDRIVLRGGRVIDPAAKVDNKSDVLIEDGRIERVGDVGAVDNARVIDAAGLVVTPGFVDVHAHLRDPGLEYKEDIESGTRAAARGGFTTVCAMPNTEPAMDSRSIIEYVLREAAARGHVRVLPIGAVSKGRAGKELAELGDLAAAGCVGFSDDGAPVHDATLMRRALEYASAFGLPIIDHCEEKSLTQDAVMHEGWVSTRLGLKAAPSAAEESLVARDIALAEATGAHVHIAHVSTRGAVDAIRRAKARRVAVTAEVTPHHLTLTARDRGVWRARGRRAALRHERKGEPAAATAGRRRCLCRGAARMGRSTASRLTTLRTPRSRSCASSTTLRSASAVWRRRSGSACGWFMMGV